MVVLFNLLHMSVETKIVALSIVVVAFALLGFSNLYLDTSASVGYRCKVFLIEYCIITVIGSTISSLWLHELAVFLVAVIVSVHHRFNFRRVNVRDHAIDGFDCARQEPCQTL